MARTCPPELYVDDYVIARFGNGFRILDPLVPESYTTCFTASYGKSLMHSGSYIRSGEGIRRFSPEEICRLLHFPDDFIFPPGIPLRKRWHLLGNSLSVAAVRHVLKAFPELQPLPG
jgi:site-specific DNA-cytosine methylase